MADLIGYAIVVALPAGLFVAYLLGWIRYDGRASGDEF